jgi:hypothetical protein
VRAAKADDIGRVLRSALSISVNRGNASILSFPAIPGTKPLGTFAGIALPSPRCRQTRQDGQSVRAEHLTGTGINQVDKSTQDRTSAIACPAQAATKAGLRFCLKSLGQRAFRRTLLALPQSLFPSAFMRRQTIPSGCKML